MAPTRNDLQVPTLVGADVAVAAKAPEAEPPPHPPTNSTTSTDGTNTKKSRAKPYIMYNEPEAEEGKEVGKSFTTIKCRLSTVINPTLPMHEYFLNKLNQVVLTINQMKVRVTMLAKELCLRKLQRGEPLPQLNQSFYSGLYT